MNTRTICITAGLLGFLGVAIGAFGAHAFKATLIELSTQASWDTASRYHLLHAVALFALGAWINNYNSIQQPNSPQSPASPAPISTRWLRRAAWCWLVGTVIFSGSIYWYALGGPRYAGAIAPIGGTALMAGWLFVFVHALKLPKTPNSS